MMTMRASFQNLIPIKPTDESMYFKDTGESKRRPSQNPNLAYDCWQQSNPRLGTISLKARVIDRSPKTGVPGGVGTYRGPENIWSFQSFGIVASNVVNTWAALCIYFISRDMTQTVSSYHQDLTCRHIWSLQSLTYFYFLIYFISI